LLSHFEIPGVERARQGLSRRISEVGVYHIALIHALNRDAGLSTRSAVAVATRLLAANPAMVPVTGDLRLSLDRDGFLRRIDTAIAEAVESVALPRRGRPPGTERARRPGVPVTIAPPGQSACVEVKTKGNPE